MHNAFAQKWAVGGRIRSRFPWIFIVLIVSACGDKVDDAVCDNDGCFFSDAEWDRVSSLAGLGPPPTDPSNALIGNAVAISLGHRFYFETEFSGTATWVDTLGRTTASARSEKGTAMGISCASCHNPSHAGADTSSSPGHVSIGAGWYDVNSQPTVNSAYYRLQYWNGRTDSLWAQAAQVMESGVSMNGNRLSVARTVATKYAKEYSDLIGSPVLEVGTIDQVKMLLADKTKTIGPCGSMPPDCAPGCIAVTNVETTAVSCMPRFPLNGKAGSLPGCQFGSTTEPMGDGFDCMAEADRNAVTRVLVNVSKVIAAYEFELRSLNSRFDQFVASGPDSPLLSDAAKRGAKLFVGRASCIDCHNTPLMSDNGFHNIGVAQTGVAVPTVADCGVGNKACDCVMGLKCLPWGYYDGIKKLQSGTFRRDGMYSDNTAAGEALAADYTRAPGEHDKGAWRTPGLRDVAITGPYMHNGVYPTLEDVVSHYNRGGSPPVAGIKAVALKPLFLDDRDQRDLVEFLMTLTGTAPKPELHVAPMGGRL